jgi:hypothetical protein
MNAHAARIIVCFLSFSVLLQTGCGPIALKSVPPLTISTRGEFIKGRVLVFTNSSDKTLHPTTGSVKRTDGTKINFSPPDKIGPHETETISWISLGFFPSVGDTVLVGCVGYDLPAGIKIGENP